MRGEPVGVEELGGERIDGIAHGIAPDGALEIEFREGARAGEIVRVLAGDVTLAKKNPPSQSGEHTNVRDQGVST
jgi:biotin-(acetyl-CoA carboxylase) ligase